jgi:ADP-L-glycero-D-manno-heptose 6-epimerase
MKNVLVTGHKGFIGQHLVDRLEKKCKVHTYEIGDPEPKLAGLDWCIHLGAITSTTETNIPLVLEQNYDFSCKLLDRCLTHGVNFQFASSASVYGPTATEFVEDSTVDPRSVYAWSKYLFERYAIKNFRRAAGIQKRIQIFRYFNVYGPAGEEHKGNQASPFYKFKQQALETKTIKLFKNSEQYFRDFVPVDLVVKYHEEFFNVDSSGIWNIGTGETMSFQQVAEDIAQKYNVGIEYVDMPIELAAQYQTYTRADITKLKKILDEKNSC